jgi:hypothetical protein
MCYKGLLHHNISCIAPPPTSEQGTVYV